MITKNNKGFTLVELSIVLVIIGLIIGGVLVGQDLIKAAEIRAQLRQFDEINTALNTFRLKYNALPGDYNAAVANLGAVADASPTACTSPCTGDGNGDGILQDSNGATGGYGNLGDNDMLRFWHHLGLSGLLAGGGNGIGGAASTVGGTWPKAKIGNLSVVAFFSTTNGAGAAGTGQHYYMMGKFGGATVGYANFLTPQQAEEIDQKIDNGIPISGSVNVRNIPTVFDGFNPSAAVAGTASECTDGSAGVAATQSTYNSDAGIGGICNIRIKMSY